jgi:deoxyribodipyrimidine photo-lyase
MNTEGYSKSLFVHRRDLRIDDNTALIEAARSSNEVIGCFIVDPRQVEDNPYRSESAVQFMRESLEDLDAQYRARGSRLNVYRGIADQVVATIIDAEGADAVFLNRDYTPFSVTRDKSIGSVCEDRGVALCEYDDVLLHAPGEVMKQDGDPYVVFTPYYGNARQKPLREPTAFAGTLVNAGGANEVSVLNGWLGLDEERFTSVRGGRKSALSILGRLDEHGNYKTDRDFPARNGTTQLSAYLKFGCCSAREAARAIRSTLGRDHDLLRQLHWRDFFTQVGWFNPRVFEGPFHLEYAGIEWENDQNHFNAWREGRTGFPIVDAGMRELAQTGYMHNRARMIVASFLTKDLHIDWRWGERHFATHLIDYDPAVNNGSWQWAASTGCDAQPYFRIFNPWLQQKKFDPDARYIHTWVRELDGLSPGDIHNLWKSRPADLDYPEPIVDHKARSREAKAMYQAARGR